MRSTFGSYDESALDQISLACHCTTLMQARWREFFCFALPIKVSRLSKGWGKAAADQAQFPWNISCKLHTTLRLHIRSSIWWFAENIWKPVICWDYWLLLLCKNLFITALAKILARNKWPKEHEHLFFGTLFVFLQQIPEGKKHGSRMDRIGWWYTKLSFAFYFRPRHFSLLKTLRKSLQNSDKRLQLFFGIMS